MTIYEGNVVKSSYSESIFERRKTEARYYLKLRSADWPFFLNGMTHDARYGPSPNFRFEQKEVRV